MRKRLIVPILGLLLVAVLARPALAQDQGLYADRYDVEIIVLPNGNMRVIERQTIVFTRGSFHEGFAIIPTNRVQDISDVQVVGDGKLYTQGYGRAGTFNVETQDDQLVVTWNFDYVSNSTHVYELRYTVRGGLRYYPEYGEAWWKAIPPEHAYPIRNATVRVKLPPGATILTDPQSGKDYAGAAPDIAQTAVATDRLEALFTINRVIDENQEVEVRVRFTPGVVAGQAPAWQAEFDQQQAWNDTYRPTANLGLGVLGAVILIGGPLLVLAAWYTIGRDPSVGLMADQVSSLPANTPPGLVGALVDEKADIQDILATLIDLARRGYLTISEEQGKGLFASRDFVYRSTGKALDGLRPYEQLFMGEFFGGRSERRLSALKNKFYTALPKLQAALYKELVQENFFTSSPESVRQRYGCAGILLLILAIGGGIGASTLVSNYVDTLFCPFVGLAAAAITLLVGGQYMPHKTRKGAEAASVWRAFKAYLAQIEKYNLPEARARFDEYLPYAVAFGLERGLIRKFASVQAPMPIWYMPYRPPYVPHHGHEERPSEQALPAGGFGKEGLPSVQQMSDGMAGSLQNMSDGLISMFNSASKTFTSQPSSSGSGRGWSGGGGFRGGGGGGGGARGFR